MQNWKSLVLDLWVDHIPKEGFVLKDRRLTWLVGSLVSVVSAINRTAAMHPPPGLTYPNHSRTCACFAPACVHYACVHVCKVTLNYFILQNIYRFNFYSICIS